MRTLPAIVVGILLRLSTSAAAQQAPPIPGGLGLDTWTRGLGIDAGTQGPPGLLLFYRLIDFSANTARDGNGNALPIPGLKIGARANAAAVAFTAKPRGAPYLTAVASLPLAAVSFDSDVPPVALDNHGARRHLLRRAQGRLETVALRRRDVVWLLRPHRPIRSA